MENEVVIGCLQVFQGDSWEYVFCYNGNTNMIITTKDKEKAIKDYDYDAVRFFSKKYANNEFRSVRI